MKKLLMVLAIASVSFSAMAQDDPTLKYSVATNSFWSNWFIQVGAQWNAWYSADEHGAGLDRSPLKDFRSNPGAAIAIGKWFTPGLGLRTKLMGIWGKSVRPVNGNGEGYSNKYWTLNENILFNLSNMLCGYNPDRVWNFIPFVGGGIGRSMTHDRYGMDLNVGLLNEFRLSRKVFLNLEIGWNRFENDIDGTEANLDPNNRGWDTHDNLLYAELGLTFNLGKGTWDKVPDLAAIKALHQSQIDALNAQLADANAEIDRLNNLIRNHKCPEAVREVIAAPATVYFYCNKIDNGPSYERDMVDVRTLAKLAAQKNVDLLITGYADSATGNPEHNQWLSDERAKTVADEVVGQGVSRSKITTVGKGGVDILSPFDLNRRAVVELK
ncbi:MAG: OmpA family protein [Prevotella sp.]|nr:OmpA family protein [Prevotella sp.]